MSAGKGNKAIAAALTANLSIAVLKFFAFLLTSSSSMLAESVHSVADSANQLLLLLGGKRAQKDADQDHPFGYGRERYIYGFIVSIILFTVGGLFALFEAYEKFLDPHGITGQWFWVPLAVLIGSIALEGYSFATAIKESNQTRGDQSWVGFVRTAKAPELPVLLLEDAAALTGLLFALFGVSLTLLTGNGIWDAVGTGLIGILLVCVAVVLAMETSSLLIGEGATPAQVAAIRSALVGPGVSSVIHLKTLHLGPEELLVGAKIAVDDGESGAAITAAIDAAEERVRAVVPIARVMYLEPDIYAAAKDKTATSAD